MRKKKQLTEQLCEHKKAAKLMAKDLETVSQKLFSLQKEKAAAAMRALMKPKKIAQSCHTEITGQWQSSCQTEIAEQCQSEIIEQGQSSCPAEITEQRQSSDDEFYDDEPERVSARKPMIWPDTEDEYE